MKLRLWVGLLAGVLAISAPALAQREMVTLNGPPPERGFEGILILGINAAQVDGDQLSGYHQAGLVIGAGAKYIINREWAIGPEIMYSRKGSRTTQDDELVRPLLRIRLDYVDFPILAHYRPDGAPKFTFSFGPMVSYLFRAQEDYGNTVDADIGDRWTKLDVLGLVGFEYDLTDWLSGSARFSYSILPNNTNYTDPTYQQIIFDKSGVRNNVITVALRLNLSHLK